MSKQVVKLDEKIIERFENSDGMFLVKGGINPDVSPNAINIFCKNENCKTCHIQPDLPTEP